VPSPGKYPLVVDPVIGNVRLTKVLMDGGRSLNIIYAETLGLLRIDLSSVRAGAAPFHGIILGKCVQPLGQLDLPVCFWTPSNFRRETLTFEAVGFRGTYHAVLGRPCYAKFMAVPNYTYLKLKTPGVGFPHVDTHGDSQLVIDQVMKNSHCRDPKMEAYCDEVRRLEDKFYGLELNHIARWYNETADELAKISSGRTTVPPDVFSRDLHQPSVKTDDTPEPEKALAQPEAPSAQSEAPSAQPEAPSAQPEAPSAPEGEALRVEEERSGVTPNRNWQTPYMQYLHRGELPLDRAKARRLARRAKLFVLLGDGKELYHRSPSGILQRCISIAEGQELLQEIHSGACAHHAAPRALVGNAFRQGFYWPTAVADTTRIVRTCQGCQFYARQTHLPAQALQTIPIT
jgi:hypothetical protein